MQNGHVVSADGTQHWYLNGQLHREGDQPARIWEDGTQEWYSNGLLHREGDQPARTRTSGMQEWWQNGQRHRDGDKPAFLWPSGTRQWFLGNKLHREGDQPAVTWTDGTQFWVVRGERHRSGGKPAVIRPDGAQEWWAHGVWTGAARVTDFRETSNRFVLVQAMAAIGLAAGVPRDTGSPVGKLLQAVWGQAARAADEPSLHVTHEHAFLVALFL